MSDVYSSVGDATPSYSAFKFHPTSTFDFDIGQVIPILRMDCIPGDRIRFENGINIQFMPLVSPLKHNITAYVNYFFVPYRILWDDWITFITGGEDGTEADNLELPNWWKVFKDYNDIPDLLCKKHTYWDYVGNPLFSQEYVYSMIQGMAQNPDYMDWLPKQFPHCLDLMAYNMIYNEWYRDQNVMEKRDLYDYSIYNQCWNKDYFTSALPWQQRGLPARIPVGGLANTYIPLHVLTYGINDDWDDVTISKELPPFEVLKPDGTQFSSNELTGFLQYGFAPNIKNMLVEPYSAGNSVIRTSYNSGVDSSISSVLHQQLVFDVNELQASGFSISVTDLRLASSLQRWMERNARTGVRYVEFLKGHYNVDLPDSTAQRPILLGSTAQDIVVSDVFQTSETSEFSALGSLAGNASSAAFGAGPEFHCLEYGVVLALLTVVPNPSYMSQGLDKSWTRKTRFDFAFPEFMHISEVPIRNNELFWNPDPTNQIYKLDNDVFGYQSAWDEYRQMHSYVAGSIRDTMDSWTLSRKFASLPHLNKDFLEINGKSADMRRIFAVTDPDEPGMVCYAYHNIDALRPIPYISEPMLIAQ